MESGVCRTVLRILDYDFFFFSSRRRHPRFDCDWSSDVCSSDLNHLLSRDDRQQVVLEGLRRALALPGLPNRIEGYDISHVQGSEQVGSQVVWENGSMKKDDYKRFRIKTVAGADDFAALGEVLTRRFARCLEQVTPIPYHVLSVNG